MADVVTFDPTNLRIVEINPGGDNVLSWREIYSEWKDWLLADPARRGYPAAFRVVGGDPISDTENLGSTFFLLAPWKFRPAEHDHRVTIEGNVFSEPAGESTVVPTLGGYQALVEMSVSTLVEQVGGGSGGSTAAEIWGADPASHTDVDTMGALLLQSAAEGATKEELTDLLNTYLKLLRGTGGLVGFLDRFPIMSTDTVHVNDLLVIIDIPVQRDGAIADLTTVSSITFRVQGPDTDAFVDKVGAAKEGVAGVATWTSDSDVFTEPGNWLISVRVIWNDGAERWTDTHTVQVLPVLPIE